MNRVLIFIAVLLLVLMIVSCGTETGTGNGDGDTGNTGTDEDTGNTGDTGDNFPNEHDGLSWSDRSPDTMSWEDAIEYCENLGGRLPTISELRTLIQNCPVTETGGECEITDDCISFYDCWDDKCNGCESGNSGKNSVFGDPDWFWSSSEWSNETGRIWCVNFSTGLIGYDYNYNNNAFRCVK